ncbi:HAD family hydrolase [Pelagibaculum spongiae]|uniref:ATPase P n=1 Tax=Pelagibaculum spongiae TaxID=2080658 RepID=A0A2V1GT98_9GAMM|nr:HAD hydrolase family protein [Pelagibaculum spongiae]PVZ68244.1 ATPase P [Pelagibaculum spongiae]
MIEFSIPSRHTLKINHVVFDFNGTLAIDGILVDGVAEKINLLANQVTFHVITADTYGNVAQQLTGINCQLYNLSQNKQFTDKLAYIEHLGTQQCICVGNGFNDREMLQHAGLGIALVQQEGCYMPTLMAADIACHSVLDVFGFLEKPARLLATLRV